MNSKVVEIRVGFLGRKFLDGIILHLHSWEIQIFRFAKDSFNVIEMVAYFCLRRRQFQK